MIQDNSRPRTSASPRVVASRHRPLVPIVIGLTLAIVIADHSTNHLIAGLLLCGMLATVCLGVAFCWRQGRARLWAIATALLLGYAWTLWSAHLPADHISRHMHGQPVTLEGQLLRVVPAGPGRTILDIAAQRLQAADTQHVSGRVRVTAYKFEPRAEAGDTVRVQRLRLRQPGGFRNPGAFDYGRYLARQGIYATASLSAAERLEVVQRPSNRTRAWLARGKASLAGTMTRAMAEPQAAIAQGMVFGLRSGLPREVQEAFAASGTAHLMSVSGLHVGFVYAATFFLLRPCLVRLRFQVLGRLNGGPRPSKLAAAGSLLAVVGYACLIGPNFPTVRATLMIATYVIAYLIDRDGDPWHTTALAALLILAVHPFSLFEIGFQLSFAGVLAILYAHRLLRTPTADPNHAVQAPSSLATRLHNKLHDAVLIAVCASVGTAPLMLYYFQRLPLLAPLANLVVVPLASLVVPLALVASCVGLVAPLLGDMLLSLTGILVTALYAIIRYIADIPYAAPRLGGVSPLLIALVYGLLLLVPAARASRPSRLGIIGGSLVVAMWLGWPALFPSVQGTLQVTFLDVGHGDAAFIRFPRGMTMLIDGGGSYRDDFDVGERVVAPFLWHTRVRKVDYMVATHPHPDHAKGLPFILRHFRVRQFWDNGAELRSAWYRGLREQAMRRGLYRDVIADGLTSTTIDGVRLEVLHPTPAFQLRARSGSRTQEERGENDRSLVLKLVYGDVSFLFTGDIEQAAEAFLVHTRHDLHATVLKVPHHGSRTSSSEAFLHAVRPRLAVFSVQRESRFGHPHPVVLERYKALGAHVFRTDEDGAVTVRTDGRALHIEPYVGQAATMLLEATPHPTDGVTSRHVADPR